jgi:glycosyltransferase involved in cell wall biosynthesis
MRIAVFSTARVPSRTANSIQVLKVCQAFQDIGHAVRLWLPGASPDINWPALAAWYGVRGPMDITWCASARPLRRYDYAFRSVSQAKGWRADVYYTWPLQVAALTSLGGLPTALEVHDRPQGSLGPLLMRLFLGGRGARRLLPITEAMRARLEKDYRIPRRPGLVEVAPMGVDLERYRQLPDPIQARRDLGWPETFTVGYTGHLYSGRGIDLILQLASRKPQASFVLAGGEPLDVQRWSAEAERLRLKNVAFLGFVDNARLPGIQAACDVLVMPYAQKIAVSGGGNTAAFASPMKVFEYLATGRPVMASDLPVFREVLTDDNAVLLPPGDTAAWEAALSALQADASRRKALGEQGRREAARHTWAERARRSLEGLEAGSGVG